MTSILGAAIGYGLFHAFGDDEGTTDVKFGIFVLFIGVAMAITVNHIRPCIVEPID